MIEKIMNRRLFAVFQAASATITRIRSKMTPPVVTSIGNRVAATSAKADRASGGTTSNMISSTKTREAIAPAVVSSGIPDRPAITVSTAVANPASTNKVPRIGRHQEGKAEGRGRKDEDSLAPGVGAMGSSKAVPRDFLNRCRLDDFILHPSAFTLALERNADRLEDFV